MRDVLALHCALASGAAWRGLAAALPGVRLHAPDLPGHGRAPDWDGEMPLMEACVARALDAAPERFDLLGHSYGGCVALAILAEAPDRVRSLALVEPVMFAAAPAPARTAHLSEMAPFDMALSEGDRDAAARAFSALWDDRPWDALTPAQRAYVAARIHLIAAAAHGIVDDAQAVLPRLPADPPPTLLVTRRAAPPIVAAITDGLVARLPGAHMARIGHGHMIPMAAPGRLAKRLKEFWGEG